MGHGCTGVARGSRRHISESPILRGNRPWKANCQSDAVPTSKSQSLSLLLHGVALAALLALNSHVLLQTPMLPAYEKTNRLTFVPPRVPPRVPPPSASANAAGGSQSAPQPARHGAPPPALKRYFIPPETNADPKLPLPLSLDFEAPTVVLAASDFGDPYSKMAGHSMGTGGGSHGIGNSGCCGGVGNDSGGPSIGGGAGHSITAKTDLQGRAGILGGSPQGQIPGDGGVVGGGGRQRPTNAPAGGFESWLGAGRKSHGRRGAMALPPGIPGWTPVGRHGPHRGQLPPALTAGLHA